MIWISFAIGVVFMAAVLILRELWKGLVGKFDELTLQQKLELATHKVSLMVMDSEHKLNVLEDISVSLMALSEAVEDEKEAYFFLGGTSLGDTK